MNADAYKEVRDEIDSLLRVYAEDLQQDPRVVNPLKEARDAANTRYTDAIKEKA